MSTTAIPENLQKEFNELSPERRVWVLKEVEKRQVFNEIMAHSDPKGIAASLDAHRVSTLGKRTKKSSKEETPKKTQKKKKTSKEEKKEKKEEGPRKCGLCHKEGHNKRSCDLNPDKGKKASPKKEKKSKSKEKKRKEKKRSKEKKEEMVQPMLVDDDSSSTVSSSSE
jgi:hypothetical protein